MRRRAPHCAPAARTALAARAFALLLALTPLACRTPPADPDGEPSTALALELDTQVTDSVHCRKGDCADWYLLRLHEEGTLTIEVDPRSEKAADAAVQVVLADHQARTVEEASVVVGRPGALRRSVTPGPHFVRLSAPEKSPLLGYQLRAHLDAVKKVEPAPPPPPRFDTLETEVLELETTRGATEYVLFGLGQKDRMAPGLRGRLVQDGENIAEIEVEEVFAEGARARLLGSPSQPITPRAMVQIDVPRN